MGSTQNTQLSVNFPITFSTYHNTQISTRPYDDATRCSTVIQHIKAKRLDGFTCNVLHWSNDYNGATAEWFAIGF